MKRRKSETDNPLQGDNNERQEHKILPVTLLSGFLGAGKTTLLKCILESKNSEMKIAIIVNDMGEINLDAKEIKGHKLI
jgi:Ni2+-binding GTPase involved in maturation of urease and hydrogenase